MPSLMPAATPQIAPLLARAAHQHAAGEWAAAEQDYRAALALDPNRAEALAGMGVLAGQMGRPGEAADYLARACALRPGDAVLLHNHGEALKQAGQLPAAEALFRRALELDRHLLPAWQSLIAIVRVAHGQALALGDTHQAAQLANELAQLCNNMGNVHMDGHDPLKAIDCYRHALSARASYAMAWSNLGNALRVVGQLGEAETACRRAVTLDPAFGAGWNNLGNALIEQAGYDEAWLCYERALALRADFPEALHNRGSGSLFNRLYLPEFNEADIAAAHRAWGAAYPAPQGKRWQRSRQPDRVLKIGYLSADFREHAMRHFIEPLLARHHASQVDIVCYAQGPGADAHTQRMMGYGHRWIWVHALSDAELAAHIERDAIDILVDCTGHTHGTRIKALAGKPAPIMMSWLGYLNDTGLPAMDYRLSDEWVDPPHAVQPEGTEAVLRIPGGMLAYRPHAAAPDPGESPCLAQGHITFGSLNNIQKLNRVIVAQWAQILQAVPHAKLLLQSKLLADARMVGRLRGLFEAFGIAASRLDLRPASADFLSTYRDIDIALDTQPYGGGATTCDALWMGVPVITLAGTRPAGRLSTSLLHSAGHPEWVSHSPGEYLSAAVNLANQPAALTQIRRTLRAQVQASALCDETGFVQRLEAVYRSAWQTWLRGSESAATP